MTTTAAYAAPVDAAAPGKGCHIAANLAIAVGAFFTFALTMLLYATGSKLDEAFRDFGTPPNPVALVLFLAFPLSVVEPLSQMIESLQAAGSTP